MRMLVFLSLFLVSHSIAWAAKPISCTQLALTSQNKEITLPGSPQPKTSVIYLFHNKSPQSLWIDHPVNNPGASAGWSSYLRPGNWSAIALNKKNFALRCAMIQPGKVVYLDCARTLAVCAPEKMTLAKPLEGNYWLAEDKDWEHFISTLNKKGIHLK